MDYYNHRMFCVNLMVTTKQKPIVDTLKMRKESKHTTTANHHITKNESKRKRKEQMIYTPTKELTGK